MAARLVDALLSELRHRTSPPDTSVATVFVGGGTPTVLAEPDLKRLLLAAAPCAGAGGEFTAEANPESLSQAKAAVLAAAGVNRISIGAQSFVDAELRVLERLHNARQIADAVQTARRHGILRIGLDLIFGVPGQTLTSWSESLRQAVDLGIEHVSCYGLTYEHGTRLARSAAEGRVQPCEEELEAAMYLHAIDTLTAAGFEHYEISNFARPGGRCRHNLVYWRSEPYIGVGPSAAGCLDGRRYRNVADIDEYVRRIEQTGCAEEESECLGGAALAGEMTMLGLRLIEGLDTAVVLKRTGVDVAAVCAAVLARDADQGLIRIRPDRIALTREGLLVADTIIADLLGELHSAG
jgi:oxygen-independent coproporphyrinogen-3 oxidase